MEDAPQEPGASPPSPALDFDAPPDHLAYYYDIAREMARRWPLSYADAVAVVNDRVRDEDHFGPYAWLLFHEPPEFWADLYYQLSIGNTDYSPPS